MFCLPFAGGNKYSYRGYQQKAPAELNIIPIELPGRGARIQESLCTDVHALVTDVFNQLKNQLSSPYVIYGHSMGTLVGYLLVHKMIKQALPLPQHLFFTGRMGPAVADTKKNRHLLAKEDFKNELRELGGVPEEVLSNQELFDFFEPVLRADFQIVDTYAHQVLEKLPIPISVAIGTEEEITLAEAQAWQDETSFPIEVKVLSGAHFFIYDHEETILKWMLNHIKTSRVSR